MAQPATRIGDADVSHCSGMVRAKGASTVFVNNIPWSRQGDVNTTHKLQVYLAHLMLQQLQQDQVQIL